jgi:hypothetical protein
LQERHAALRARYGGRVACAPGSRALVSATRRAITELPAGWGVTRRLAIPVGGGELSLPSGASAIAEPIEPAGDAYVVRSIDRPVAGGRCRSSTSPSSPPTQG